jgi:hypothetical protein
MKPSRGPERFFYDKTTYTGALLQYCSDPLNISGSDPLNMLHLYAFVAFDACAFMSMQVGPQKVFIPVAGQAQQLVCTAFTCFDVVALALPPM